MLPIQKLCTVRQVFREVPDTDLANFFWLKAPQPDVWVTQIRTFAISAAVTSIVGYVVGLGDRHPANVLIDRETGKVIHIDFGDCFELAEKRPHLPETVPFRLTRMMVRAMGPAGVRGAFRSAFVEMATLLRVSRKVLLMVLAIFVQEPVLDQNRVLSMSGMPTSQSFLDAMHPAEQTQWRRTMHLSTSAQFEDGREVHCDDPDSVAQQSRLRGEKDTERVEQKLLGTDFGGNRPLTVDEQAEKLISAATSAYNLSKMYHGWFPFW
jgi:phosphatidylinositol kinase/protein kinase (PI-3  family)